MFDINFYSFHNSSDDTVKYFQSQNKVKNTQILRHNNCSYSDTIKSLLKTLDRVKCTHLFFSQDDTFSAKNDFFDFEMFLKFLREKTSDFMVCMAYSYEDLIENDHIRPLNKKIYRTYDNSILMATTLDYLERPCIPPIKPVWNMSDDPYVATIDLVKRCYDENYFNFGDVWNCEVYLKNRFAVEEMTRNMFERPLFRNYNLIGQNSWDSDTSRKILKNKNLL